MFIIYCSYNNLFCISLIFVLLVLNAKKKDRGGEDTSHAEKNNGGVYEDVGSKISFSI